METAGLGGTWRLLWAALVVIAMVGCKGGGGDSDAGGQQIVGGTGTAMLSWAPPVANNDGSPVDLMGFVVYIGASPQNLHAIRIVSAIDTSVVIDNLPLGMYYFAVTALSISGAESAFSNIESKTII